MSSIIICYIYIYGNHRHITKLLMFYVYIKLGDLRVHILMIHWTV